jgi:hypothetical protein
MIKRIFLVMFILGFSGCTLPDYVPSTTSGSNAGTPVFTPDPVLTPINEATKGLPEEPGGVTEPPPADGYPPNTPQATIIPDSPLGESTDMPAIKPTPFLYTRYLLQPGSPTWVENFIHPEAGCNWMGVGGQVFDLQGNAVSNLVVKLTGTLNGEPVELIALTGGALNLGPGGYEFKLSDHPFATVETLWVSAFDKDGNAISDPEAISTYDSCEKNFVIINFSEAYLIGNGLKTFLPFAAIDKNP